jgi:hypothetical protein
MKNKIHRQDQQQSTQATKNRLARNMGRLARVLAEKTTTAKVDLDILWTLACFDAEQFEHLFNRWGYPGEKFSAVLFDVAIPEQESRQLDKIFKDGFYCARDVDEKNEQIKVCVDEIARDEYAVQTSRAIIVTEAMLGNWIAADLKNLGRAI